MNKPSVTAVIVAATLVSACGQQTDEPQRQQAQPDRPATTPAQQPAPQPPGAQPGAQPAATPPETVRTQPAASGPFQLNGDASRGQPVYAANCTSCHGAQGRGDGPAGRALRPPATDFTQAENMTAERAYLVVRDGGMAAGLAPTMMAFNRALDDQQIRDVVAYVMQIREGGGQ